MNNVEYVLRIVLQARDHIASVLANARKELEKWRSEVKASNADMDAMNRRISSMNTRVGALAKSFDKAGAAIHNWAANKRDADDLIGKNIELFGRFERVLDASARASRASADEAREISRAQASMSRSTEQSTRAISRQRREVDHHKDSMSGLGDNIASLDNRLRGIGLLVAFTFAQQLLSALVGLGGQFVAVAGSAAMAGSAIGGGFVAGVSQAVPAVLLLVGALQRAGAVMDAVDQAQKMQQQQFVQNATAGRRTADATDQIANSQDALAAANDRVALASENLRRVRREAEADLQDLILAEREAELAAKGAALSQRDAQEALRATIRRGDISGVDTSELSLAESRLRTERQIVDVRRTRQERRRIGGDIENMESVRNARHQLEEAERAAHRASRSIEGAKRNAAEAAEGTITAAATLDYFISQLSPAERRLYEALTSIRETYKRTFRPITDIIIDSFTRTVERVEDVIQMPKVVDAARELATEIAEQLDRITDFVLGDEMVDQFLRVSEAGRKNLPIVTDIVINLAKAWANVAEFAGPAFREMLQFIGGLANRFEDLTSNQNAVEDFFQRGEEHFEGWINLGLAVIRLFAAIAGPGGGADSGLDTINDATRALNGLTDDVHRNAGEVQQFFADAQKVTYDVIRVLVALAEEIFKSFDAERVGHFADFLIEVVIPALGTVIRTVGSVTSTIAQFLSLPVIRDLAKWGLVLLAFGQVASSTVGAFDYFRRMIGHLLGPLGSLFDLIVGKQRVMDLLGRSATRVGDGFKSAVGWVGRLISRIPGLSRVGDAMQRFALPTPAGLLGPGGANYQVDSQGNVVPVGTRAPQRRRRRLGRAGLLGAAGVGAAAVALNDTESDFRRAPTEWETFDLISRDLKSSLSAILSLDIKGFGNVFVRAFDGAGKSLEEFGKTADEDFKQAVEDRDVDKLRDLAEQAREGAKRFPEYADSLNEWADAADKAADDGAKIERTLDGLSDFGRRTVERLGIEGGDIIDPNAVSQFASNMRRIRNVGVSSVEEMRNNMAFELKKINEGFESGSQGWYQATAESMENSVEAIQRGMENGAISQKEGLREIRRITREQMRLVRDNIDDLSQQSKDSIAGNFRDARLAIERQTGGWRKATGDALRDIRRLMRTELEIYGLSPAQARRITRNNNQGKSGQFGAVAGGGNEGAFLRPASGGIAGGEGAVGQRGEDAVDARIGLGEMVLGHVHQRYIAPAVEAFYGHPLGKVFNRVRGIHAGIGRWAGDGFGFAGGYAGRTPSGARAVPIPGFPGEFINSRVLRDALALVRRFKLFITDAFATSGHTGAGHLQTGTAIDVVPRPGRGSWDDVDAAVEYARQRGMTVLYNGVAGHGRGHHAHIELERGAVGAVDVLTRAIRRLNRIGINGPDSPLRDVGVGALENVRGAARSMLRRVAASSQFGEALEDVPAMDADADVVQAFRQAIRRTGSRGRSSLALWMAGIVESGLRNLPYGDADSEGALQLRTGIHGRGLARNPLMSAIAFLTRGFTGRGGAIALAEQFPRSTAGQIAQMVQGSAFPDRYDQVAARARRYMGMMFGGGIPGFGGGDIHPRLLEGGEHVWTKEEVQRAGGHSVMKMLRAMLGGGGQGGPNTFQEGGEVSARQRAINRLSRFALSDDNFRSAQEVLFDISKLFTQVGQLRAITKGVRPFIALVSKLAGEGGLLDELRTSVERRIENATRRIQRDRFRVDRRGRVTERLDEVQVARREVRASRGAREEIVDERDEIARGLRQVRRRQGREGLSPGQRRRLQAAENNLQQRLRDADGRVLEATESVFNAQEALAQAQEDAAEKRKQDQQDIVDDINKQYSRQLGGNEIFRRMATALGNQEWLQQINAAQRDILEQQANELEGRIDNARKAGNEELAQQLEDQVQDLRTQIFESVQQNIRDAMDAVNNAASRRTARLDLFNRMLDAVGAVGQGAAVALGGESFSRAGVFAQRGAALETQRAGLQGVLRQAEAAGNLGLIQELTDSLVELDVTIQENTRAAFQARVDEVNQSTSFALNVNDLNGQITRLEGEISGNTNQAALLAQQQERHTILLGQRTALEALLAEAQAAGDQQATNDLTVALLENQVAVLENTKAINEINGTITEPQSFTTTAWTMFREAIFNGVGQILPQYAISPNMQAYVTPTGVYSPPTNPNMPGSGIKPPTVTEGRPVVHQDIDINYNEVNEAPSPVETASRVAWYGKTANTQT